MGTLQVDPVGTAVFVLLLCAYGLWRWVEEEVVPWVRARLMRRRALNALAAREQAAR
jgi:hypothetical protein